jgi:serine/threonine protein kinase
MNSSGVRLNGEALIGKLIADRYVILGTLGSGAMGTVYKARHKHLNREVALKVLKRDAAADDLSRKRFENEAKAASALHHVNLIAVNDFGFAAGLGEGGIDCPFLVMDYVEGQSLAQLVKQCNNVLPDEQFLNIMAQICAGLAHAHEKGLVHRDLKPSNILITHDDDGHETVKIVDFGLAKSIHGDQDLTSTGQIFGTPLYMSPEQCQGRKLDPRSDVYSLGCLMYRLLSGNLPFNGDTPVATIIMHVKDAPPTIPEQILNTKFKRAVVPIIMKALEKEPDNRQQNVNELRIELISAMEGLQNNSLPEPITEPIDTTKKIPVDNKLLAVRIVASTMLPLVMVAAILTSLLAPKHSAEPPKPVVVQQVKLEEPAPAIQQPVVKPIAVSHPVVTHRSARHTVQLEARRPTKKRGFWKSLISKIMN